MSLEDFAQFYRQLGYQAEANTDSVWYRVREGFLVRVPHHIVHPPAPAEMARLLRRHRVLGLRYSLPPGELGQPGAIYFVRDPQYDLSQLGPKIRARIRRGLRNCTIRVMSFTELHEQGLPLNEDTLRRQKRSDPYFTSPALWARLCQAGDQCPDMHVWGAFVGDQLAAYSIVVQMGTVAVQLYQMSRESLMRLEINPALKYLETYELVRQPGITAVSSGHVGLDSTPGLDEYKLSLGYVKEPVTFVVKLRPAMQPVLLNRATIGAVGVLRQRFPDNHLCQRLQAVLDIAARSVRGSSGQLPA